MIFTEVFMAKILIVDDDDDVRLNLKRVLCQQGHEITEAVNGMEGMAALKKEQFDLMLLDILMPKKGGIQTLMEIKHIENLKKIIITGNVQEDSEAFPRLVSQFGARKVLFKPFKKSDLIEAVDEVLASA